MQINTSLSDTGDGAKFKLLAYRMKMKPTELAKLVLKKFVQETFWENNGESGFDPQIQGFNEYLDSIRKSNSST